MWCHLCKIKFADQENFKVHILMKHRPASEFYEADSDSENSDQKENVGTCDISDESELDEDEDMLIDEDIKDFSIDKNYDGSRSRTCANTSTINTTGKSKKYSFCMQDSDSKDKSHLKLSECKSNQNTNSECGADFKQFHFIYPEANQETKDSSNWGDFSTLNCPDVIDQLPLPTIRGGFDFNSRNILIWLLKFKEMSRTLKFPLEPKLFIKIKDIHKAIFDHYNTASSNEVTASIMKVYEEFDNMILKHITSINDQL